MAVAGVSGQCRFFPWQSALLHGLKTHQVVILTQNIRDRYVLPVGNRNVVVGFDELLAHLLCPTCGTIRRYDVYQKVADLSLRDGSAFACAPQEEFGAPGFLPNVETVLARIHSDMLNPNQPRTWLLKQMHNLLPLRTSYSQEEGIRLVAFQNMIEQMAPGNRLILCYLSDTQVPMELAQQSHRVAFVNVPLPDYEEREAFWADFLKGDSAGELARLTDGMPVTSLHQVRQLAGARAGASGELAATTTLREWEETVAYFKFGEEHDPYTQITTHQLENALEYFTETEGIRGQDFAIQKAIQMLWKARTNVPKLLRSGNSQGPRGCMFLAGPSGTGKTMLGQKIAKFVFGSEEAFHRIDMSEYGQEFSVSGLIGAPPGYVGHESGGVLTNAMIRRPFSVVLFDEIEKCHKRVYDLLLQLLSDGRLTDSRGQTVFFSQAIVIFTSNLGTRAQEAAQLAEAKQSGDADRVREHFVRSVRNFFRFELGRPELLNRLGNNIVPFNFLDSEDVLLQTARYYLARLRRAFNEEHSRRRVSLAIDSDAVASFLVAEYGAGMREFGGRAVVNAIDDSLLPLLAWWLLRLEMGASNSAVALRAGVRWDGGRQVLEVVT